jgi:hypothetical protein
VIRPWPSRNRRRWRASAGPGATRACSWPSWPPSCGTGPSSSRTPSSATSSSCAASPSAKAPCAPWSCGWSAGSSAWPRS